MEIPESLKNVCSMPVDDDTRIALPPQHVVDTVRRIVDNEAHDSDEHNLAAWMREQAIWQGRANALLTQMGGMLSDPTRNGLPAWITQEWPVAIRFPWSAGLANAVCAGELALG